MLVEIADNGPGIASATREHLFEPFFTTSAIASLLGGTAAIFMSNPKRTKRAFKCDCL